MMETMHICLCTLETWQKLNEPYVILQSQTPPSLSEVGEDLMTTSWDICPSILSHSPGSHPEVFLDEVAGDGQWQEGDKEHGGHVGDDTESWHTQQGGAHETLQGGGDVLIDSVDVCGKPVQDAAKWRCLKQPGEMQKKWSPLLYFIRNKLYDV